MPSIPRFQPAVLAAGLSLSMLAPLGCAAAPQAPEAQPIAATVPPSVAAPALVTAVPLAAAGSVASAKGVVVAPGALDAAPPKLRARIESCLGHYIERDVAAVEACFDPEHVRSQSGHSSKQRIFLEAAGFFICGFHMSGPHVVEDSTVWRELSLIEVTVVTARPAGAWDVTGRVRAGASEYELHLTFYGDEAKGYVLRGPIG